MSSVRSSIALALSVAAALLTFFFVVSGLWLFAPFVFARGGGGEIMMLILVILGLAAAAHLVDRRAPS